MRDMFNEMFSAVWAFVETVWNRPELRYIVLFIIAVFLFRALNRWLIPKLRRKRGLRPTSEPYFSPQEEMASLLLMLLVLALLIFYEKGWLLQSLFS